MSPPEIQIEVFGKTDVGLIREHNEDRFLVANIGGDLKSSDLDAPVRFAMGPRGAAFVVCDGMGGAAAGEVASLMAVETIFSELARGEPPPRQPAQDGFDRFARALVRAIEVANERIFAQSRDNQSERGMGTTCTAAACIGNTAIVAQVGDSRCYMFRDGTLSQVTKDQSLAWQLIEAGAMTPEEAKAFEHANIILQALGVQDRVEVVLSKVELRKGDVLLLCSDGLHGPVADEEMAAVLRAENDLGQMTDALVQKALERDGPDNVTVVLARFDGEGLEPPRPDDKAGFVPFVLSGERSNFDNEAVAGPEVASEGSGAESSGPTMSGITKVDAVEGFASAEHTVPDAVRAAARAGYVNLPDEPARPARGVLAVLFLALLAAAAGAVFVLKCEHEEAVQVERPEGPR